MANLIVNVQANLANFMSGMAQIRQTVQQVSNQVSSGLAPSTAAVQQLGVFQSKLISIGVAAGTVGAALTALGTASIAAFSKQESAFAGVLKTVDATDAEFAKLRDNFTALSNRAPISFSDLAKIGELAGQLGVRGVENLTKFTDTIARVAVSTNLTAEAAATAFARIANIMQEPIANVDRMGAVVVDLGNKFATTEQEIVNFSERIAGAGKIAGLTTADIMGISAAFSSVGIQAEAGGTAIQKVLISMTEAVSQGGEKLRVFAEITGMTEKSFQQMFKTQPAEAFTRIIEGLKRAGDDAFQMLDALGLGNERVTRAMLSAANAGDLVRRALTTAKTAWQENIALIIESEKRFATFASSMQTLKNTIENFSASIGEQLIPFIKPLVIGLSTLFAMFQSLPAPVKTFLGAIVGLGAVIAAITAAVALAVAAFVSLAGAIGGLAVLGKIALWVGIAVAAIGLLGTAIATVVKWFGFFSESTNELEKRLRSGSTAATESVSVWKQFGTAVSEAWEGLKVVTGEVWTGIWNAVTETTAGIWSTITSWGSAISETWMGIWSGIRDTFLEIWGMIPGWVKDGVSQMLTLLNPLKGVIDGINYLRERGRASLEAERQRQRELDNEMKREIGRGQSMMLQTEAVTKTARLSMEQYELAIRKIELAAQAASQKVDTFYGSLKIQRTADAGSGDPFMEQRQQTQDQLNRLYEIGQVEDSMFAQEMSNAKKLTEDRKLKMDEITKKWEAATGKRLEIQMGLFAQLVKQDREEEVIEAKRILALHLQGEAATAAYGKMIAGRMQVSNELRAFEQTDFQQFETQERERWATRTSEMEESMLAAGASGAEVLDAFAKETELWQKRVMDNLTKGVDVATNEYNGLAASVGMTGEAAFRAQQAFVMYKKAYSDLTDEERRAVDIKAKGLAQLEEITKKTQALIIVHAALMTGYAKEITLVEAMRVADIKLRQQQLSSVLDYYKTLNQAAQTEMRQQAEIDMEIAENKGDLYKFLGAATRKWVADQQNVWAGFGSMIRNTFDGISRTLSDVFFNLFTGQTIKLQDVWKSMLNMMLRELANFLAAQTVRIFLGMLGNLMNGQPATQGLFGGESSGTTGAVGQATGATGVATGITNLAASGVSALGKLFGSGSTSTPSAVASSLGPYNFMDSSYDFGGLGYSYYSAGEGYYMAAGGSVPGSGTGDVVPAMLTPGEFVVRREVAQGIRPLLTILNNGGSPRLHGGRYHFAEGGVVPSLSGDQAIINLLYEIYRQNAIQTGALQATAANTGATAQALGEAPATSTAGVTTISGVGGNVQVGTASASGSGSTSGGSGGGSTGSGGSYSVDAILSLLRGGTGLVRSGTSLFTGLSGTGGTTTAQSINSLLSILSGGVNLASGISSGSTLQTIGGSLSLASGIMGFPGVTAGIDSLYGSALLGSGSTSLGLGGAISSTIGIAGGGLGLYSSIQSIIEQGASVGNIAGALMNAYTIYAAAAPIISAATGTALPTFGSLAASAISSLSPTLAASLGIGGGVSAAGAAGTLGAGVAVTGGATAAAAGSGAAFATIGAGATLGIVAAPLLIGLIFKTLSDIEEMEKKQAQLFNATQTTRGIIQPLISDIPRVADETWSIIENPASTPEQIRQAIDAATYQRKLFNEYDNYFREGGGYGFAPEQLITIGQQLGPYLQAMDMAIIRGTDRLAVMAPELIPRDNPFINPLTAALTFGVGSLGLLRPSIDSLKYYYQTDRGSLPGLTYTPSGYWTTSILEQIQTLQPGNLEQGISQLAALYGVLDPTAASLGFGTMGTPLATQFTRDQASIDQALASAAALLRTYEAERAVEQAYLEQLSNVSPGGLATGGWVTGGIPGRDSVPSMLMPGEFVVPRGPAQQLGTRLYNLIGQGAAAQVAPTTMPMTINITVNGNVDDPEELARIIAPKLRDELRRIDTRYSRAGNKTQA